MISFQIQMNHNTENKRWELSQQYWLSCGEIYVADFTGFLNDFTLEQSMFSLKQVVDVTSASACFSLLAKKNYTYLKHKVFNHEYKA